jgi:hypothetical protein
MITLSCYHDKMLSYFFPENFTHWKNYRLFETCIYCMALTLLNFLSYLLEVETFVVFVVFELNQKFRFPFPSSSQSYASTDWEIFLKKK